MKYYVYKCNSRGPAYARDAGDWQSVFDFDGTTPWGTVDDHPDFLSLKTGDRLIAQQSNRKELVGVAEVVGIKGKGSKRSLLVRPLERIGVKIPMLKQQDSRIAGLAALQGGDVRTLYDISKSDAEHYLRIARKVGSKRRKNGSTVSRAPTPGRVLFARVGRMQFYAGPQSGDEGPVGGGSFNRTQKGGEVYNFKPISGRLYGYFQPVGRGPNLGRIEPGFIGDELDKVLVVFVAQNVVVGWYWDATVFATTPPLSRALMRAREGCPYICSAKASDAVLLPTRARRVSIPKGKGGMGQANVGYSYATDGTPRRQRWIENAVSWIRSYDGPNILVDSVSEAEDEVASAVERTLAAAGGQGFSLSPEARRKIEERAMTVAAQSFERDGYSVERRGKPYDLRCTKKRRVLYVEVKGTQSTAEDVILTYNEVEFAKRNAKNMALYIVHSISISGANGRLIAWGGKLHRIQPWPIEASRLRPIAYKYAVPGRSG